MVYLLFTGTLELMFQVLVLVPPAGVVHDILAHDAAADAGVGQLSHFLKVTRNTLGTGVQGTLLKNMAQLLQHFSN